MKAQGEVLKKAFLSDKHSKTIITQEEAGNFPFWELEPSNYWHFCLTIRLTI